VGWYRWQYDTLMLDIRLQPRASKDEIIGEYAGRLKIRLAAPPVDGQANKSLLNFMAKICQVPLRQVSLLGGATCRDKLI
jgi:uncharacterized protein